MARAPTKSTASAIHKRIHGVDAGWLRLRNCRCNPYIEVQGRTMFDASKLMVNVSGAPLCSVEKPKSETAHKKCGCYKRGASREGCGDHPGWPPGDMASPFLHVVVLSRKDPHGEWVKYPKDFFFKDQQSHLQLDLPNVVHATQIRLMFVCATNPDPDAMPGCFNPEIDAHRIIQIDVLTEVTDFRCAAHDCWIEWIEWTHFCVLNSSSCVLDNMSYALIRSPCVQVGPRGQRQC